MPNEPLAVIAEREGISLAEAHAKYAAKRSGYTLGRDGKLYPAHQSPTRVVKVKDLKTAAVIIESLRDNYTTPHQSIKHILRVLKAYVDEN